MNEKKAIMQGVFWKFAERIAAQSVSLVVSIILARLISPNEYGIISLVTVFITIANIFVTSGFGAALIQKKDADEIDYSSVFYFNLVFSTAIYIFLFFLAIPISNFYEMPLLKPVLRVLSFSIPIMGIISIQQAYITRRMEFKKFFKATFIGTVISAFVGIAMAYMGFGVWALVAQTLTNNIIDTIILQLSIDLRIKRVFSIDRIKTLLDYGWKLLAQSLIVQIYSSLRSLFIGKIYTAEDLAYYTKGNQFPDLISSNIDTAINTALFPAMSRAQESIDTVKKMARKTTQVSSYVMGPILIGFIAVAEPFISLLLTDKWLLAVPFLKIECIILLFRAPQTAILQGLKAIGKSDSVLKCDIPIRIFALLVLFISIRFGVIIFAFSEVLTTVFGTISYSREAKKHLNYNYGEVLLDFGINTLLAAIMGLVVWEIGRILPFTSLVIIVVQVICGFFAYLLLSILSGNSSYKYVLDTAREFVKGRRK